MLLPNLFVAGAQKSGTTTLHNLLNSHPDIYFPASPQEIHFFDIENNFRKGLEWYTSLFSGWDGQQFIAQTSPLYMYLPSVPKRIHQVLPNAKTIFILRNPIDRAYSHYWHEIRYGREHLSFVEALEAESNRIVKNDVYRRHYSYVDRGHYSRQIEKFQNLFSDSNLLVLLHDELKNDPSVVLERCAKFLDIDASSFSINSKPYNSAKSPRSLLLQRMRPLLETYASERVARVLDQVNLSEHQYQPMKKDVRQRLQDEFQYESDYIKTRLNKSLFAWS